ncbi:MAG: acyl-CoA/acyl-ACP dehydrogenase [Porticoccaceae bacterium]|nr:acyl-CoA/acyl-ACP dehydrogenase [Porticoccaceae bacterium]
MTYLPLNKEQQELKDLAAQLANTELAPRAAETDKTGMFPRASLDGLKTSGLWGLRVSREHGGLGADLLSTCLVVEELAKKCASTAMCYKMHIEAAELMSRMPSEYQAEHFVKKIATGEILCTVAGGETSGGGGDWVPGMVLSSVEKGSDGYILDNVRKSYVTSAGQASHYFMLCRVGAEAKGHQLTALFIEADKIDWKTLEDWNGLGMRGNNSMPICFNGVVPGQNRLGEEGAALKYLGAVMMPVVALTYGAAYLGVASGAYELAMEEASKVHPSGAKRLDSAINQRRMAELSAKIEAARALLHVAATAGDAGQVGAPLPYLQAKVCCSEVAVLVTQELMTMFGGTAFAARLPFERYFRDARAGMIMGLANDDAYQTIYSMLFPEKRS